MEVIQVDSVCMDTDCGHSFVDGLTSFIFTFPIPDLFLVVSLSLSLLISLGGSESFNRLF
jgi:hypothetical protein